MLKLKSLFTLLICSLIFISCKKEKAIPTCSVSKENIAGTYKVTSLKYKESADATEQDFFVFLKDCVRDNLIIFKNDDSYIIEDAGIKCSPGADKTGNWGLSENVITASKGIIPIPVPSATIVSFDCKTLVLVAKNTDVNGDQLTFTLAKQK